MEKEYVTSIGDSGIYSINTGAWRVFRPVKDDAKCNKCGNCFLYCPVFSIYKTNEGFEIDLSYCKGCGICANECRSKAITMQSEGGV